MNIGTIVEKHYVYYALNRIISVPLLQELIKIHRLQIITLPLASTTILSYFINMDRINYMYALGVLL